MSLFPGHRYCIDTSALIDLKESYPRNIFLSLWENIENLISQGRLIAPREVLKELEQMEDELWEWAKNHMEMFKDLDHEQQQRVRDILKDFPNLVDVNKTTPEADPFVVAIARVKSCTVITSEKPANPGGRPKIPDACRKYNVKCTSLIEFFKEQNWRF